MRWLLGAPLMLAALLLAACGDDGPSATDGSLAASFVRLGESIRTEVTTHPRALPDDLDSALNPGLDADAPAEDRVTLPAHPDGELIGSIRMRGEDGAITYFITYEVEQDDRAVEETLLDLLDESPWQVVGGQSADQVSAVRFDSTISGDIVGTAVVQPLPTVGEVELGVVGEDGDERTVTMPRRALLPLLPFRFEEGADSLQFDAVDDAGRELGLTTDDELVSVAGREVSSIEEVQEALLAIRGEEEPLTSIVYVLQISPPIALQDFDFTLGASRPLPPGFPLGFIAGDESTVLSQQWSEDPGISTYSVSLLSDESTSDAVDRIREAFEGNDDWTVTEDQAVGFATQLAIEAAEGESAGAISVDTFPEDDDLTLVLVQVQVVR